MRTPLKVALLVGGGVFICILTILMLQGPDTIGGEEIPGDKLLKAAIALLFGAPALLGSYLGFRFTKRTNRSYLMGATVVAIFSLCIMCMDTLGGRHTVTIQMNGPTAKVTGAEGGSPQPAIDATQNGSTEVVALEPSNPASAGNTGAALSGLQIGYTLAAIILGAGLLPYLITLVVLRLPFPKQRKL
jgi:predicted MFS family arabinose efflux permease